MVWIEEQRQAGTPVEDIADQLRIPLEHVFGAADWRPPKRKKKPRSLDDL